MIDIPTMALGGGFGAVAGVIIAQFIGLPFFETTFFFLGGVLGAALSSGAFGDVGDVNELFT